MDIKFLSSPLCLLSILKNNGFALEHSDFVNDAILELLQDNRIEELTTSPEIINPLTVSVQSSGKKRLILDLRHIISMFLSKSSSVKACILLEIFFLKTILFFLLISNLDTTMWIFFGSSEIFRIFVALWH